MIENAPAAFFLEMFNDYSVKYRNSRLSCCYKKRLLSLWKYVVKRPFHLRNYISTAQNRNNTRARERKLN